MQPLPAEPLFSIDPTPLEDPEPLQIPGGVEVAASPPPNTIDGSIPETFIGTVTRRMVYVWAIKQRVTERGKYGDPPMVHENVYPTGYYLAPWYPCELRAGVYIKEPNGVVQNQMPHPVCWGSGPFQEEYKQRVTLYPGTVYGVRGGGAPVGCSPNPAPCYTWSGATTWKLYPYWFQLLVTASPSSVMAGDTVTFTASRNDGYALPGVERWIWRPKDSTQAARTVACTTTSTTCRTAVYEDGWMFAQAELDGLQTNWAGVNVTDELLVECTPVGGSVGQAVTRGDEVECTGRLRSGRSFTVSQVRASIDEYGTRSVSGTMSSEGTTWTSRGLAANGTTIWVKWSSGHEGGEGRGSFAVAPRQSLPDPQLGEPDEDTVSFFGHRAQPQVTPDLQVVVKLTLGQLPPFHVRFDPERFDGAVVNIMAGPNEGLSFLTHLPMAQPKVYINDVFFVASGQAGNWKNDQNGTDGTSTQLNGVRYCDQADIPAILADIRRHEGIGLAPNSHAGIFNEQFRQQAAGSKFENIVFATAEGTIPVRRLVKDRLDAIVQPMIPAYHDPFDRNEDLTAAQRLGCAYDNNPFDP
jgi:hypothetical protein